MASLRDKQDDLENQSRRSSLRIRGLPETIIDLNGTGKALFQELCPNLPVDRLEMDRVHRAMLGHQVPPLEISVKCHYFHTKDLVLRATASKPSLAVSGP